MEGSFHANLSSPTAPSRQQIHVLLHSYRLTVFSSGVFIGCLSLITLLANGLLLLAIWKDPFRTFRIPSTVFVIGLSIADFLTGLVAGPLHAYIRISYYLNPAIGTNSGFITMQKVSQCMSYLTMNASYHVLLFMTWSQYTAVSLPHNHRSLVTTKRVIICVCCVWMYAIIFALLPVLGTNSLLMSKLDLYLNTTTSLVLLVIAYICLYSAFHRRVTKVSLAGQSTSENNPRASRRRRRRSERQFTVVTLVLVTFIILFTLPSAIIQYIGSYWTPGSREEGLRYHIASQYAGNVLFLKFALDPFIYCWRLSSYRRALKSVLMCGSRRVAMIEESIGASGSVTMRNRSYTGDSRAGTR